MPSSSERIVSTCQPRSLASRARSRGRRESAVCHRAMSRSVTCSVRRATSASWGRASGVVWPAAGTAAVAFPLAVGGVDRAGWVAVLPAMRVGFREAPDRHVGARGIRELDPELLVEAAVVAAGKCEGGHHTTLRGSVIVRAGGILLYRWQAVIQRRK